MKIIALSYSDLNGGAFRAAYRLHQALLQADVDSMMFTEKSTSTDLTIHSQSGNLLNFYKYIRPRIGQLAYKYLLTTQNSIIHSPAILPSHWPKILNRASADIINIHWVNYEMLSIEDIGKIKKPIVWTLHDMWAFCGAEHYTNDNRYIQGYSDNNRPILESGFDLNRWTWKRKIRSWERPIHIVTPSQWLANCVKKSAIMRNWPITVIPNTLDTLAWRPIDKKIARRILNLPEDTPILSFGAIGGGRDFRKGVDLLFSALNHLRGQTQNLQLLVFGEKRPEHLPDIGFPIHYLGHLFDDLSLRIAYSAVDAIVVPSRMEAFGQTATEANACGTPVIAFNSCGLSDIVSHKKNGWLARAFDTEDLALGIQWLLESDDRKQELSKQARIDAVARYSYPVVANSYKTLYQQVLNTNGK